jgi:hypothetical protein
VKKNVVSFWAEIRSRLHLTRYAIAKKLKLAQPSWDNLELHGGRPSLNLLVSIKKLSGFSGNELFALMEQAARKGEAVLEGREQPKRVTGGGSEGRKRTR